MRAVIQRVKRGSVSIAGKTVGEIAAGLVILLGVGQGDTDRDVSYLAAKIAGLRIFEDEQDKMNLSIQDVKGEVLVVSQFTLYGDCRRGRRPSYSAAAPPDQAVKLYEQFVSELRSLGLKVATGIFQSHMQVEIINDGPVTILLDSNKMF
ncbi:D-aminoacyl-tRNA deacylase [Desulfolucanica intricata]|uniref:D-aminoacyl-tRNA deacylase n=1 Tax=Desulfolucanica intricata TaxID=1285191 RepID=UPI000829B217|nr:D-aminoacyl-tRNA deacylase [Desulfolucanica intricata]